MAFCKIHFQRGLFCVEPVFYELSAYIPYEADDYNTIIECSSMDITTIRRHINEMGKECYIFDDYGLYTIDE